MLAKTLRTQRENGQALVQLVQQSAPSGDTGRLVNVYA